MKTNGTTTAQVKDFSQLKINGTAIKNPSAFNISTYKLSKSGRLSSGLMTFDTVAIKRTFKLTYEVISGVDMGLILDLLDNLENFYTFEYTEMGIRKTATVYSGAFPRERFRMDGIEYWKNMEFQLIEQ